MSRAVTCPECDASFKLRDDSTAKRVKCPKCGGSIPIVLSAVPTTKGKRTESSPVKSGNGTTSLSTTPWVFSGALGLVFLLGVGGFFLWLRSGGNPDAAKVTGAPAKTGEKLVQQPVAPVAGVASVQPAVAALIPPPAGELEALEEMTSAALNEHRQKLPKRREGTVSETSRAATFSEQWIYEDPKDPSGLVIRTWENKTLQAVQPKAITDPQTGQPKTVVAEMGQTQRGQSFSQQQPRYSGTFGGNQDDRRGMWFRYHENGKLRMRGRYLDGQRNGDFLCADESGRRTWEGLYLANELVESRAFKPGDPPSADIAAFYHEGSVRTVAWSPDGKYLASEITGGMVRVWDMEQQKSVAELGPTEVPKSPSPSVLRFVGDGKVLAVGTGMDFAKWTIRLWKFLEADEPLVIDPKKGGFKLGDLSLSLDILDNGRKLLIGSTPPALWDVETNQLVGLFEKAFPPIRLVDNNRLMVAQASFTNNNPPLEMLTFDIATQTIQQTVDPLGPDESPWRQPPWRLQPSILAHPTTPRMTFSMVGQPAGSLYEIVFRTVDILTGEEVRMGLPKNHHYTDWLLSPNGTEALAVENNIKRLPGVKVRLLNTEDGAIRFQTEVDGFVQPHFTPDGRWLFGVGRGSRRFLNESTRKPDIMSALNSIHAIRTSDGRVWTIKNGNRDDMNTYAVSPDGQFVAIGAQDGSLIVWSMAAILSAEPL
ncbi:MAG: MJ0042-type zinc finger domain-containing protein [Planctomycetota bacterium]